MDNPAKLPEIRKEAFSKARESLGLSAKDLSVMACLSVRQIEQIENGESSSFYGLQIKVTAAKKVAALLKLNLEDAFDFGEAPMAKKAEVEKVVEEKKEIPAVITPLVEKNVSPVKPETAMPLEKIKELVTISSNSSGQEKNPQKKLLILLGVAVTLIFVVVNLRPLFFPEPVKQEIVILEEVAPANPPAEPVAEAKPEEKPVATVLAVTPPAPAAAPVISLECPPADSSVVSYKTDAPKKSGDVVHLKSKTAQTVCVVDASGKTQNKTLEPGVGASILGKPPLKVLTSGLAQVDMYYQGMKVRLSNPTAKTIILEQAEIIQPSAPLDSQLR
jgi:transcriptional regulator with XRE-family HTH domain